MIGSQEHQCAIYTAEGRLLFCRLAEKDNMLTGAVSLEHREFEVPLEPVAGAEVQSVQLGNRAQNLFVAWSDGRLLRYDMRDPRAARPAEVVDVVPDDAAKLTVCRFILARETLICGDSSGGVRAWFRVRESVGEDDRDEEPAGGHDDDAQATASRYAMVMVHDLGTSGTAVRSLGVSQRSRIIAVGYEDGSLRVFHVTTEQQLLETSVGSHEPVERTLVAAKDNGLFALSGQSLWRCDFDPLHPEATLASLFAPVWYEGYDRPRHIWQSSFAGVASEMKLGMQPLVFGTLKATFYSMLLGAPLALLAAIYTSEFLSARSRSRIKPVIEMMASLPSVVLGFLAALVFAPLVEHFVPSILCALVTVPLSFLLGAQLWQLIPYRTALRHARLRLVAMSLAMFAGFLAAGLLGPPAERFLFAGDIRLWLDGQIGDGIGAWMFVMLPLSGVLTLFVVTLYVNPWLRSKSRSLSRAQFAWINLGKFVAGTACMAALAYGLSFVLTVLGLDPRGTYIDTFEQRNALVVGFVMGLAIIPIIYTIADDALSTVPSHLRSGSLGCGATPWQTTWRVVIPTAMSGLFSALMIGLGRAVGETMIVLMAGGNTPIIDWNVFNGFRTLAANIMVE
ncbi:MAG: ABC transporter permease subunit, partial [Planctomycetes bacterium]|nr:ABC transporter permease subunit [Planctomycetota bacterium]